MMSALSRFSMNITSTVKRHVSAENSSFGDFPKLKIAEQYVSAKMEKSERAVLPPIDKRLKAIADLRQLEILTNYDWKLIFAGLSDKDPNAMFPILLEDNSLYYRVKDEIQQRINRKNLKRRDWAFLCSSYFGYHAKEPDENKNWCSLREQLLIGYRGIKSQAKKEKEWMKIIDKYSLLFTPEAGSIIAEKMSLGELVDFSALDIVAQIPNDSWLWYRAFAVLLPRILKLDDDEFIKRLPHLLELARQRKLYTNLIIRACLTQYYRSSFRNISHPQLKQMALDNWGSPQLHSKQNIWLQHLNNQNTSENICAMVRSWLAKEDLTHFFQLLKGNNDVDQARLFFWLRFANQMGFTRIVMGADARNDYSADFVEFKKKNKGRLSFLSGGASADNAVIMQIGDYFFVEFSRTGNALYVYNVSSSSFNPEKKELHLTDELKMGKEKFSHAPTAIGYKDNHLTGWMIKYEDMLRQYGIKYLSDDIHLPSSIQDASKYVNKVSNNLSSKNQREHDIQQLLSSLRATVSDKRDLGGALHVRLFSEDPSVIQQLIRLGFKQKHHDPLSYWSN